MDYIRVTLDFEDRHYERKRADLNFRLDKKNSKDYVELGVDADDYYRIKDSE